MAQYITKMEELFKAELQRISSEINDSLNKIKTEIATLDRLHEHINLHLKKTKKWN